MSIKLKLGYSWGSDKGEIPRIEMLKAIRSLSNEVVEIGLVELGRLEKGFSDEEIEIIRGFKYISLHAPAVVEPEGKNKYFLKYQKSTSQRVVDLIQQLRERINIDTVLFHPDTIEDYEWISEEFGEALAFENMDVRKNFGNAIQDMELVFDKCPRAKWVCDVNHIYTIDKTMMFAKKFHERFLDRLCHYHLSAYIGFHAAFVENTNENIILEGVQNLNIPIVHEGGVTKRDIGLLNREDQFVRRKLL